MVDNTTLVTAGKKGYQRKDSVIILLFVAILICTFLRASLLLIYPFVVLLVAAFYRWRISSSFIILSVLVLLSFAASFFGHIFLRYKLLSLFYMLPFLLLLFSAPPASKEIKDSPLPLFIKSIALITVFNDLMGFVQVFINPVSDDSFIGIYSQFSVSLNGLMLINTFLFFYYFFRLLYVKRFIYLPVCLFFLVCSILGFYGAGLFACLAAFILSFLQLNVKSIIRTLLISLVSLSAIFLSLKLLKPQVLEYNLANIRQIMTFDSQNGARKVKAFYNYGISYPFNIKDFLLGSGPGTFNSRTAFMIGSPTYFTVLPIIKDDEQPYYFKNYAYSLWNESNNSQASYQDGFRNQPFSSVLSFLGEYGLIFFLSFSILYYRYYSKVSKTYKSVKQNPDAHTIFKFFKLLAILLPFLLLIDNYYEYPEIMLLVLLGMKFSHIHLITIKQSSENELS